MTDSTPSDREFELTAKRLVDVRGISTLGYVKSKIEEMRTLGDDANRLYWETILKHAELLLFDSEG